jgi:hypothetical protein
LVSIHEVAVVSSDGIIQTGVESAFDEVLDLYICILEIGNPPVFVGNTHVNALDGLVLVVDDTHDKPVTGSGLV